MSLNEHCLHLFNCLLGSLFIYQSCRNLFPVCQTIGLADVDNVSDLQCIKHLPDLQLVVFPFGDYLLS